MSDKDKMNLSEIYKTVHELDEALGEEESAFKTAALLITLLQMPPDAQALSRFLKLPLNFVEERLDRLKTQGVLDADGKICTDWFDEESGGVAFWMDVAVAEGILERTSKADETAYVQPDEEWPSVIGEKN